MPDASEFDTVSDVVRRRRTAKRLLDPSGRSEPLSAEQSARLQQMLEAAGEAPFHKRAHDSHRAGPQDSPVPWRFHVLEHAALRALNDWLAERAEAEPDGAWGRAWGSKIPALLAAAGAVVLVTWLPDPGATPTDPPQLTLGNIEHIAAASAAVQNLLLLAEAAGWSSYWSSGGVLAKPDVFAQLDIPAEQQLLGAIQLAPADRHADKVVPGGLHDQRGAPTTWLRRARLAR